MTHSYWKFDFIHRYIHYKCIILCIECQIWTSLRILTKSLEKIQDFVSWKKKSSLTHGKYLNNLFGPNIFTTNTSCANVYKMYECDKNKMPYHNVKVFLNQISGIFGPLIEHGPHWINFIILIFISEKNR